MQILGEIRRKGKLGVEPYTGRILGAATQANYFLENLRQNSSPLLVLDILIVAVFFYWIYVFLKETRAMRILYGLFFLLILMALGRLLNLVLLNWILKSLMTLLVVAIPVVFQPELRAALEKLGRAKLLGELSFSKKDYSQVINELLTAVHLFSKQKIGALIVLKRNDGLKEYINNGIEVDATVSAELLSSIFFPKSPLHDGAVVISGDKIVSASSVLPVSQVALGGNLGTRHKAALGITEDSDALVLVVSEETGNISLANGGRLETKISEERLKNRLTALMRQNTKDK